MWRLIEIYCTSPVAHQTCKASEAASQLGKWLGGARPPHANEAELERQRRPQLNMKSREPLTDTVSGKVGVSGSIPSSPECHLSFPKAKSVLPTSREWQIKLYVQHKAVLCAIVRPAKCSLSLANTGADTQNNPLLSHLAGKQSKVVFVYVSQKVRDTRKVLTKPDVADEHKWNAGSCRCVRTNKLPVNRWVLLFTFL